MGFDVLSSTGSVPWYDDASVVGFLANEHGEHEGTFKMMPAPSNAALHRYIRIDLAAMRTDGKDESRERAIVQLELLVKVEQEATQSWIIRPVHPRSLVYGVCKIARTIS
jgi:hypothetical protein